MHAVNDTICEAIEPLLTAYAFGEQAALDDAEVAEHVRGCAACRATLAADQATVRLLAYAPDVSDPRPELRAMVLDAVDAAAKTALQQAPGSTYRRVWRWAAASLVAVVFAALLIWNISLQQQLAATQLVQQQQLLALFEAPNYERYPFTADAPAPGARAQLAFARNQAVAILNVEQLPALPANRVYQIWLIHNGVRTNGGTFAVDSAGRALVLIQASQPLSAYDGVGVTVEPVGGSAGPTTPRVMGCKLT